MIMYTGSITPDEVEKELESRKTVFNSSLPAIVFFCAVLVVFYVMTRHPERLGARADGHQNKVYFDRRQMSNEYAAAEMDRRARERYGVTPPLRMTENNNAAVASDRRRYHVVETFGNKTNGTEKLNVDDVKRAVAVVTTSVTGMSPGGGGAGKSKVVQVKSAKDGQMYFVAADLPHKQKAADKLAEVQRRSQYLLQSISEQLDGSNRIKTSDGTDITDNMKQLVRRHYKKIIPMAEYHNPSDKTVGSNTDKGMMIEMCLRGKHDTSEWNSDNTMFRVHVHELAHSADFHYRGDGEEAHGPQFKRLHQYLLGVAENLGIYSCSEYMNSGKKYCSLRLTESYCGKPV